MARLRLNNYSLPLEKLSSKNDELPLLRAAAAAKCRLSPSQILQPMIVKRSLDARVMGRPAFVYTMDFEANSRPRGGSLSYAPQPQEFSIPALPPPDPGRPRPLVVGAGPAGLLAAWALSAAGLRPLVIEQGKRVEQRAEDVARFNSGQGLDYHSNIQFGEGGAGAFSDGKLTSRSKDPLCRTILSLLIHCGADPAIGYCNKPHVGSDRLPLVISQLRQKIEAQGGEFLFETELTDLIISAGRLCGVGLRETQGRRELAAEYLVLAVGNGARGVYRQLAQQGLALEAKAFAVGLRLEQEQQAVDLAQFGAFARHPLLGAADYSLTYRYQQGQKGERGVYTFCNCPGGRVVNASSEAGGVVTNGASLAARSGPRCNAAVVAQVEPGRDFGSGELDGLEYQIKLEQAAYALAGGGHFLPYMSAREFCGGPAAQPAAHWVTAQGPGLSQRELRGLLSGELEAALAAALLHWQEQLPGLLDQACLYGVESRTSAPLRLLRGADRVSLNCRGLYPAGEGAGYAGGIISSAVDGLHAALAIIEKF